MSSKWFLKSKTVLGAIAMAAPELPKVLGIIGVSVGEGDVDLISGTADAIIQLLGFIFVIIGRFKSSGAIHFVPDANKASASSPALAVLVAAGLAVLLAGCAGAMPWNKQQYAGLTVAKLEKCSQTSCSFVVYDGKESGAIDFKVKFADGTVMNFAADDVKAFEGQAIRGDVEKMVAEQFGDVAPGLVDAIINAVIAGGVP